VAAVSVCRTRAPEIAARLSAESGAVVGRTALRVRNPVNAPDDLQRAVLEQFSVELASGKFEGRSRRRSRSIAAGRSSAATCARSRRTPCAALATGLNSLPNWPQSSSVITPTTRPQASSRASCAARSASRGRRPPRYPSTLDCDSLSLRLYHHYVFPHLLDLVMSNRMFRKPRDRTLAPARGRILEIGFGTG